MLATPAAPDAGDVKTSAVFAVQASPLPDKLIKSLPVDGTAVAGVSVIDMVTPVAPRITELKTTAGIAFPNEPSTIVGNIAVVLRALTTLSVSVIAAVNTEYANMLELEIPVTVKTIGLLLGKSVALEN